MGLFGFGKRDKEGRKESITHNEIGEEIHIIDGEYGRAAFKKINTGDYLYTGDAWCPDCHQMCKHKEGFWECPICSYSITDEELEEGEGFPTLESTYEDDYGYFGEDDDEF